MKQQAHLKKQSLIDQITILITKTYLNTSPVTQRIRKALLKLSLTELDALEIMIFTSINRSKEV